MIGTSTGKWAKGPSVRSSSSLVQFSTQSQVSGTETRLNSKAYGVDVAEHVLVSVAELAIAFKSNMHMKAGCKVK